MRNGLSRTCLLLVITASCAVSPGGSPGAGTATVAVEEEAAARVLIKVDTQPPNLGYYIIPKKYWNDHGSVALLTQNTQLQQFYKGSSGDWIPSQDGERILVVDCPSGRRWVVIHPTMSGQNTFTFNCQ